MLVSLGYPGSAIRAEKELRLKRHPDKGQSSDVRGEPWGSASYQMGQWLLSEEREAMVGTVTMDRLLGKSVS